jgi:DNA-directed RNA polymerase subunit N (RpoN/RPB10)
MPVVVVTETCRDSLAASIGVARCFGCPANLVIVTKFAASFFASIDTENAIPSGGIRKFCCRWMKPLVEIARKRGLWFDQKLVRDRDRMLTFGA